MIEDLDGGDTGPSRAPLIRGISVSLVFATIIGWAALQSPALRGPYATPDPSAPGMNITWVRYTPAPHEVLTVAEAAAQVTRVSCIQPGANVGTTMFLNGQSVVFSRPVTIGPNNNCFVIEPAITVDRFSR